MFFELNNLLYLNKEIKYIDLMHTTIILSLNKIEKNDEITPKNKKIIGKLQYEKYEKELINFYKYLQELDKKNEYSNKDKQNEIYEELKHKFESKEKGDLFEIFYQEFEKLTNSNNQSFPESQKHNDLDKMLIVFDKLHGTKDKDDPSSTNKTMYNKEEGDNFGKICFSKISEIFTKENEINENFLKKIFNPYLLKYNPKKTFEKTVNEYYANQFSNFLFSDQKSPVKNDLRLIKLDETYQGKFIENNNNKNDNQGKNYALLAKFNSEKTNYGGALYGQIFDNINEYQISNDESFKTFIFQWIVNYYILGNQDMVYFNFIAEFDSNKKEIKNLQIIDLECVLNQETSEKRIKSMTKNPLTSLFAGLIQTAHDKHNFQRKIDFERMNLDEFDFSKSEIVKHYDEKGEITKSETILNAINFLYENKKNSPNGKLISFIVENYNTPEKISNLFKEFIQIFKEKMNYDNLRERNSNDPFIKQMKLFQNSQLNDKLDTNLDNFMNYIIKELDYFEKSIPMKPLNYKQENEDNQQNDIDHLPEKIDFLIKKEIDSFEKSIKNNFNINSTSEVKKPVITNSPEKK